MAAKPSLERMHTALIAFHALAQSKGISGDEEAIEALKKTVAWMRSNEDAMRLAVQIKSDPAIMNVIKTFPDAKIVAVRATENADAQTSQ